jgi:hypothetical protein
MLCIMRESGDILRNSSGVLAGDFPGSVVVNAGSGFWVRASSGNGFLCGNRTLSLQSNNANVYYCYYGNVSIFYRLSLQLKRVDSTTYKWQLRIYGDYFYEAWGSVGASNNSMCDWTGEKSGASPTGTYNQTGVSSWVYAGYPWYNVGYQSSVEVS